MGMRNCIRKWLDSWEKVLGEYLGWYEPDPTVEDLGSIWNKWEETWCKALGCDDCELNHLRSIKNENGNTIDAKMDRQVALYLFYGKFRSSYKIAKQKIEKNKDMNMKCKRRFIYLLFWTIIIHIPLFLVYAALFAWGYSTSHLAMVEIFLVVALVLGALIIAKDLDIQKYQETWARHTRFQYHREQEMLRFLLEAEPYNQPEANQRVDTFVKAILAIEEKNIEKFCTNMEEKEKGMMEELLAAAKKKGLIP